MRLFCEAIMLSWHKISMSDIFRYNNNLSGQIQSVLNYFQTDENGHNGLFMDAQTSEIPHSIDPSTFIKNASISTHHTYTQIGRQFWKKENIFSLARLQNMRTEDRNESAFALIPVYGASAILLDSTAKDAKLLIKAADEKVYNSFLPSSFLQQVF